MRKFFICSLLILFILAQCSYSLDLNICRNKHPFFRSLESLGVGINTTPESNHLTCVGEWDKYESCCEDHTFHQLVNNKIASNLDILRKFERQIATMEFKVKNIVDKARRKFIKQSDGQMIYGKDIYLPKYKNNPLARQLRSFQDLVNWIRTFKDEAIRNQRKCVIALNKINGASLCSLCSGRSEHYITADKRIKMPESSCRSIITECGAAWKLMLELVTVARRCSQLFTRLKFFHRRKAARKSGNQQALDQIQVLEGKEAKKQDFMLVGDSMRFVGKHNLWMFSKECKGSIESCPTKIVSPLCEGLVRINRLDYLATIKSSIKKQLIKSIKKMSKSVLKSLKKDFEAKQKDSQNNWSLSTAADATFKDSPSRLLQIQDPQDPGLPEITVVLDIMCQMDPCPIWSINP